MPSVTTTSPARVRDASPLPFRGGRAPGGGKWHYSDERHLVSIDDGNIIVSRVRGNVLFGGIIGAAVDGTSGAMKDLLPNLVYVKLKEEK